jgi:BMFP domain-containing protein YqiC
MTKREQVENEAVIEVLFDRINERLVKLREENEKLKAAVQRLEESLKATAWNGRG